MSFIPQHIPSASTCKKNHAVCKRPPYVYGTSVSVAYVPDSDHVQTWTSGNWKQTFGYDENGRLNQAMAAKYSGANPIPADTLGYYYGYDTLNRRNLITREDGSFWDIGYNTRSEVTAAKQRRGAGSSNYLPGRQFTYAYDNLGNRTTAKSGGVTSGSEASLRTTTYAAANALNQYSLITNPSTFDVTGISLTPANYNPSDSATEPVGVKVGTGAQLKATTRNPSTASTYARWHRESTSTVTTGSQARVDSVTVYENGTVKNTGKMSLPAPSQSLAYDLDGNLTDDGVWLYTWDGENRLKSMEHKDYGGSASKLYYKLTFDYDSQSRRIRKQVQTKTTFGGAWGGATSHLYVYDDWNLLLWVNGSVAKQGYHWLPDMSGTWQGAGGVRGLVGISYKDQGGAAYYWSLNVGYDGNGNVVGLYGDVGGSTGLYAVYEYDPFGNTIRQNVTPAGNSLATTLGENPFRFSTKFTDDESKLIYYGYRYYSAGLGRWTSRDPMQEEGGLNLYLIVGNNAMNGLDTLGLIDSDLDANVVGGKVAQANQEKNLLYKCPPAPRMMHDFLDFMEGVPPFTRNYTADDRITQNIAKSFAANVARNKAIEAARRSCANGDDALQPILLGAELTQIPDLLYPAYFLGNYLIWNEGVETTDGLLMGSFSGGYLTFEDINCCCRSAVICWDAINRMTLESMFRAPPSLGGYDRTNPVSGGSSPPNPGPGVPWSTIQQNFKWCEIITF